MQVLKSNPWSDKNAREDASHRNLRHAQTTANLRVLCAQMVRSHSGPAREWFGPPWLRKGQGAQPLLLPEACWSACHAVKLCLLLLNQHRHPQAQSLAAHHKTD